MIENRDDLKKKLTNMMGSDSFPFIVIKGNHDLIAEVCTEVASELKHPMVHYKQGVHNLANDIYGFKVNGNYCQSLFTRACAYGQFVLISRADQSEYRTLQAIKPAIDHGHYYEGSEMIYDMEYDKDGNSRAICVNTPQDMKEVKSGFKVIASVSDMEWMHRWADNLIDLLIFLDASNIEPE